MHFAKLLDTYHVTRYGGISNIPDGDYTFPSYLSQIRHTWESSPKRLLKLVDDQFESGKEHGHLLLLEVEYRNRRHSTHAGHAVVFDKDAKALITRRRYAEQDKLERMFALPLVPLLGAGIGFLIEGQGWVGMLNPQVQLSRAQALEIGRLCIHGEPVRAMQAALSIDKLS